MKIEKGDIIKMGKHRLLCGDGRNSKDVDRLIGKAGIRMILTDPPYGVAYVESKKGMVKIGADEDKVIENDQEQSPEEFESFTRDWLNAVKGKLEQRNAVYIFNGDLMFPSTRSGMEKAGFYYSQMLVWVKNTPVIGRKDYLPMHELIAYGWYGRHKHERSKGKSVIFYPKPARSRLHPTMKPVGLLRQLILNSTKTGDAIYDPFGGSGSTLIASDHTFRTCYMVEIDPAYCETIVARWEKLTGNKAEKL